MALSAPLANYLKKGQFPLTGTEDIGLWNELLEALETDADGTIVEIKSLYKNYANRFSSEMEVNDVEIDTGQDDLQCFLGAAHSALCAKHEVAHRSPVQELVQRVRALMRGKVAESKIELGLNPKLKMGNGLISNPLTCLPDSAFGVTFGSQPDQKAIGEKAPLWKILKRRAYENQGVLTKYGAKPHYVLAHLLNHNLNGSGSDNRNVVPFWSTANTAMARQAEDYVKQLVLWGAKVQYTITVGAPVGMTKGRKALQSQCNKEQWELVQAEQWLPMHFVINCKAWSNGSWVDVVNVTIDNYVPETVPYMRKKG